MKRLTPVVSVGVRNLRNLSGVRFIFDDLSGRMVGCRNPVLGCDDAAIIVFVMADKNVSGGRSVFADNDG